MLSADAGIAPLLLLNHDAVGFHLLIPLSGSVALECTTSAGFSLMGHTVYSTSTYPPEPGIALMPWFHVGEELGIGFPIRLRSNDTRTTALRLRPISLSVTWSPFYYVLFGAGIALDLEIQNRHTEAIVRPLGVFVRANYRPTDLGYNALFQAGLRFTALW
jgi:hypothetical protein